MSEVIRPYLNEDTALDHRGFEAASALSEETLRQRRPGAGAGGYVPVGGWTKLLNCFPESEWAKRASYILM